MEQSHETWGGSVWGRMEAELESIINHKRTERHSLRVEDLSETEVKLLLWCHPVIIDEALARTQAASAITLCSGSRPLLPPPLKWGPNQRCRYYTRCNWSLPSPSVLLEEGPALLCIHYWVSWAPEMRPDLFCSLPLFYFKDHHDIRRLSYLRPFWLDDKVISFISA